MAYAISPYCISAYIVHFSPEGARYLLIRRCGESMFGTWQMVSGKVEPEEKAYQTALREIYEETGLVPYALHVGDAVETFYTQTYDKIMFLPVFVAFVKEMDVQLSHKEHDAYEWLPFQEAKNRLVWAEQKRAITHVHEHFVLQKPNPLLEIDLSCSQRTM